MATSAEVLSRLAVMGFESRGTVTVQGKSYGFFYNDFVELIWGPQADRAYTPYGDSYADIVQANNAILADSNIAAYTSNGYKSSSYYLKWFRDATGVDLLIPTYDFLDNYGIDNIKGWTASEDEQDEDYAWWYQDGTLNQTSKNESHEGFIGIVYLDDPYLHNYGRVQVGNHVMSWDGTNLTIS